MTKFSDLYEKFLEEVRNLQETCPHDSVTDWMTEMQAPGRIGNRYKLCPECMKTIEFKFGSGADLFEQRKVFSYPFLANDLRPKVEVEDELADSNEGRSEKGDV